MVGWFAGAGATLRDAAAALADLVLPGSCAGCAADSGTPICPGCAGVLSATAPHPATPTPAPAGMPPCAALADYDGVVRELLLGYKERGRHDLARPLGGLLATVVAAGPAGPLALVPVPDTARAARQRYGDHMARLAGYAARALHDAGVPAAVFRPLSAAPRPDSATLDTAGRARSAVDAFRVRRSAVDALQRATAAGAQVVILDDIVTTGVTLATVARQLGAVGVPVDRAAVLAATRRRVFCADPYPPRPVGESAPHSHSNEG